MGPSSRGRRPWRSIVASRLHGLPRCARNDKHERVWPDKTAQAADATRPARLQDDAGLHRSVPEPDCPDPALGAGVQDLHAELGAVLGGGQQPARTGLLPTHLWRLLHRGADQCLIRFAGGLGAGAIPVSRKEGDRRAGGPAVCLAHRRCRHRADGLAGRQRLGRPSARTARHQAGVQPQRHCDCTDLHWSAIRRAHRATGSGRRRKRT